MGNRDSAAQGTDTVAEDPAPITYSVNLLQQYDGITHTRKVEITGQAVAGADVELALDGGSAITLRHDVERTQSAHLTGDPNSFRYVHTMTGTEARWLHVSIKASVGTTHIIRSGFTYVPPASESLDYDDDGNLTSDGQWTYTWDAENRLIAAEQKSLPVASGFTAPARKKLEFDYDYKNRRISKRVSQSAGSGWALTKDLRFVYDGWQMIAELDHTFATGDGLAGSAVNRTFLWGPDLSGSMTGAGGVGGLLSTTYQGVTYQVCSDANGNVTGLVPVSGTGAGTLVARFDYDPFGNRVTNAGPNVELCPFGFSSKYLDMEIGIVSYELRMYSPAKGRWMSRDLIEEKGGIHLHKMLGNDPVNRFDVLGMIDYNIGIGIGLSGTVHLPMSSGGPTFVGLSVGYSAYIAVAVSSSRAVGWSSAVQCAICHTGAVTVMVGPGLAVNLGGGPLLTFGPSGDLNDMSGYSTQIGGGIGIPIGPGPLSQSTEVTVDVDIKTRQVTVVVPKFGFGYSGYLAIRVTGSCTGCTGIFSPSVRNTRLIDCLKSVKAAIAGALSTAVLPNLLPGENPTAPYIHHYKYPKQITPDEAK